MRINTGIMRVSEFQGRGCGIFVERRSEVTAKHQWREIFAEGQHVEPKSTAGATTGLCRSYGAWYCLGTGFYKDVTPTALGNRTPVTTGASIKKLFNAVTVS